MTSLSFPFTTQKAQLTLKKNVSEKKAAQVLNDLTTITTQLQADLHHRKLDSLTLGFNEAPLHIPLVLPADMWDFLMVNMEAAANTSFVLKPFGSVVTSLVEMDEAFLLDAESMSVTKLKDIKLDSSVLLPVYLLEQMDSYIKENIGDEFLLSARDMHIARGSWLVSFWHPTSEEEIQMEIEDTSALLALPPYSEEFVSELAVIIEAPSIIRAREAAAISNRETEASGFKEISENFKVGISIITADGGVWQFP